MLSYSCSTHKVNISLIYFANDSKSCVLDLNNMFFPICNVILGKERHLTQPSVLKCGATNCKKKHDEASLDKKNIIKKMRKAKEDGIGIKRHQRLDEDANSSRPTFGSLIPFTSSTQGRAAQFADMDGNLLTEAMMCWNAGRNHHHHHWAAVLHPGWENASLSCAVLCQIVSLPYLSRSSIRHLAGLPCRLFWSWSPSGDR